MMAFISQSVCSVTVNLVWATRPLGDKVGLLGERQLGDSF